MLCQRADEADDRLPRSEKGSIVLSTEVEMLQRRCEEKHEKIATHKDDISKIKDDMKQLKDRVDQQPSVPTPALGFDSLIISQYRPLFEEFRAKRFNLLWQGSRDGFIGQEFHLRCDGRANTLTLIADTDGNVFGGFSPVKWEFSGKWKGDDSLRSFLFTLKNPHGVPPRKFGLKAEKKQQALWGDSTDFTRFDQSCDIYVSNGCNANRYSYTHFGIRWSNCAYANDTALEHFLTGAEKFTVKESKVFENAALTTLPADIKKCANGCLFQEREREMQEREQPGGSGRHKRATAHRGRRGTLAVAVREG
jgi:hypothetical protein